MLTPQQLLEMMAVNNLAVVSVLADAGNGEIKYADRDLALISGQDDAVSTPQRILHWDAEWHYDPEGVTFERKMIGGHLILVGLKQGGQPFAQYTYPIFAWAKERGGIVGFAHMQYLPFAFYPPPDGIPRSLDCCAPLEYPVETALGTSSFVMEDVRGSDTALQAYYRLLNTGFRPGIAAGTDYSCNDNEPLGTLLTYVRIPDGKLTYDKWIDGIAHGRTVVSRNAHNEFLSLKVNETAQPGDEVRLQGTGTARVRIEWRSLTRSTGRIELVKNGAVVASQTAQVAPGSPAVFAMSVDFHRSGWLAARRMDWQTGHRTHTGAVFVILEAAPIRASADDARFFVSWIDNLLTQTSPGGEWSEYFTNDRAAAQDRYRQARAIFVRRAAEAEEQAISGIGLPPADAADSFNGHKVVLDGQNKIIPWSAPVEKAYDHFLRLRWDFIKTKVPACPGPPPRSSYPQYYFFCAFWDKNGVLSPDTWMNDLGEKIPNWFESARLYYAYTGDATVMTIVKKLMDYTVAHGTSPSTFAWPNFPYTTTNAGDVDFRGFTSAKKFAPHEIQVGYAGDMGLVYYRMYLYSGDPKYLTAALQVADILARKVRTGTSTQSVWPDRVIMDTGKVTSEYGAHWTGCYMLLDQLIRANLGDVNAFEDARAKVRDFLLQYPLKTGYWADGHTDVAAYGPTYKSNTAASNFTLALFDYPELDPDWRADVPKLIKWTEDNFVFRCAPGEPATQWGANIVGEQDSFLPKMDYQTARYAGECARWYAASGDESYKERAYRSLNWVTYCNKPDGEAIESPVSKDISNWWSDCYGECPRMFYHAFAAVPEWAPPGENHILYSEGVLKDVSYSAKGVQYTATQKTGTEYLRLAFRPTHIRLDGARLSVRSDLSAQGYKLRNLGKGDFAVTIRRIRAGKVVIR